MSILQNAIDSIILGVEDYQNEDPRRIVSATRNIFSGILLLFKHKLVELSPLNSNEVLIKKSILPRLNQNNNIEWVGRGDTTVDVSQIKDRFDSLGISVDWKKVDKINKYRNDIEHYYSSLPNATIQGIISDCFIVIRNFIKIHLKDEPFNLLGSSTWKVLAAVNQAYEREKKECEASILKINWKYNSLRDALIDYSCHKCGSGLIDVFPSGKDRCKSLFKCRSCGEEWNFESIVPSAISDYFSAANHCSIKDGEGLVTVTCPTCSKDTYILEDNVCVFCDESMKRECEYCGCKIPGEELDGEGICAHCSHMISKDD